MVNVLAEELTTEMTTGNYVSGLLAIPVLLVLLAWARALSWVDKDAIEARLPRDKINSGLIAGLILAFAGFFLMPNLAGGIVNFLIGFAFLLVVVGIEAMVYLQMRKKAVGLGDLKGDFQNWIKNLGRKAQEVEEIAGAVQIVGPSGSLLPAPKVNTPEAASYEGIQRMLTDPLTNNAEVILIEPSEGGVTVRYAVDGVTYTGATVPKNIGAEAIAYLKVAAGLDMGEVRKPQKGSLKLNINAKRKELAFETKGSTAGEFARFVGDSKKRHDFMIDTLGFSEDQLSTVKKIVLNGGGVVVLAAPKGQGLTSLSYGMLRAHDAFLQNIMTIERDAEQDLEGINQTKLPRGATAAEEAKQVNWIISQQPDIVMLSKPESPQAISELIKAAKEGKRVYFSMVASSTFEALEKFRKLVGDDRLAVSQLQLVICGRNLRKLCAACKQGYNPDPETLRKLNMDSSRVETLYQARKEPIRDPKGQPIKCEFCNDLRYRGRTGMYEVLVVDDHVKLVATNGLSIEQNAAPMKAAFRKQKGRYLQEVGLALVEKGDTSVQEVLRVLKPPAEGAEVAPKPSRSSRRPPPSDQVPAA